MRVVFVSSSLPRRCGIATFTSDLMAAVRSADPSVRTRVAAIDEPVTARPYGPDVRWRIRQGSPQSYADAADAINASNADVVNLQHEFGLYGVWPAGWETGLYEDHVRYFLKALRKPVVTTLHTVLPKPSPSIRDTVRTIVNSSDEVVVMAETAIELLQRDYGITTELNLIPHGMPAIQPRGRHKLKTKLGLEGRQIISTFGLVDRRKGLEYVIEAMAEVIQKHPDSLYLIAGQTHPEVLAAVGEEYRNGLVTLATKLGLTEHVLFVNQYLTQRDIIDYLLASDVYVTPYLDPHQITSGTLAYALGAGKAIISTPYLHAAEALADDRGILVGYRDAAAVAGAIDDVLSNPERAAQLEHNAYQYAKEMTWPKTGKRFDKLMGDLLQHRQPHVDRRQKDRAVAQWFGRRLAENPLITPADVKPILPGMEVVSTFNAAATRFGDEVILLVRVAERPRPGARVPSDALTIDFAGPEPHLEPLAAGIPRDNLLAVPFFDTNTDPPKFVTAYLKRDMPGLDLSEPGAVRYRSSHGGFASPMYDFNDMLRQTSHLRVARSTDGGVTFTVAKTAAIAPANDSEEYGCEDPRITCIDGTYYITYVSVSRMGMSTSLATTRDFRSFERWGMIFLPDHKDVVIFPEKIGGRFVALTRPMPGSFSRIHGIWIAYSDDLHRWGGHREVAMPRTAMWDEMRTGASCVPFRVSDGWLEIYHGVDRHRRYTLGALLLDGDDPSRVIARSPRPILVPTEDYERAGFLADVIFAGGHIPLDEGSENIRVYYGAADSVLAAADFSVRDILNHLESP